MTKRTLLALAATVIVAVGVSAQSLKSPVVGGSRIPDAVFLRIVKAEDARDLAPIVPMLTDANPAVRYRAALAIGRIGDDESMGPLLGLLGDNVLEVRTMAAFAVGEVESVKGADAILAALADAATPDATRARAVEAAGKIAAANPRDAKFKALGDAVVAVLESEDKRGTSQHIETAKLAITAALRARPAGADRAVAKFLASSDARVRGDAANTLARLRARNANADLRSMLRRDPDANARANAARALGAAEDKEAYDLLLDAAVNGDDQRVRVSATRSLAVLRDAKAIEPLSRHGIQLIAAAHKSRSAAPSQKTELLEIASAIGRLAANSNNQTAIGFLEALRALDKYRSAETETALAAVAPTGYAAEFNSRNNGYADWRVADAYAAGLGSLSASTDTGLKTKAGQALTNFINGMATGVRPRYQSEMLKAIPGLQRANGALKPSNLDDILRNMLTNEDVQVRATAAELLAAQKPTTENVDALKKAFGYSLVRDRMSDDAQLGIMSALNRLNKKESVGILLAALDSPNYLVRRRAFQLLGDADLQKDFPGAAASLESARRSGKNRVLAYTPASGTRLGQIFYTDADYRRSLSRTNGSAKAVLATTKGTFTIALNGADAPLAVDNFIRLARVGYFNGAEVHRVVAHFVMQDGDPTGTGSGGPGFSIRCEINMAEYGRGALGMALSGKDTGGSQWFVTHSPQPHLDGGYAVFGQVGEKDMNVVDNIVRGDKIISVRLIGR